MNTKFQAMIWAAIIITAALLCAAYELNQNASFGIVSGLSGAAWGSLQSDMGCGWRCLS